MTALEHTGLVSKLEALCDRVAAGTGIEIVEAEVRGSGAARLVRVLIDKPSGVTHADCETISRGLGALLDEEDVIPGDAYTLEVSSPGIDRKLSKPRDFARVVGKKLQVALKEPLAGQRRLEGKLAAFAEDALELETDPGHVLRVPLTQVQKANLKFEW